MSAAIISKPAKFIREEIVMEMARVEMGILRQRRRAGNRRGTI